MNTCLIALLFLDKNSLYGSLFYLFSHGITTSSLFFIVGILYELTGYRNFLVHKGLIEHNFFLGIMFFIFTLGNLSFPLTANFIGEFLIYVGILNHSKYLGFLLIFSLFFFVST